MAASYIRCRNCGKYMEENQSIAKLYCSEACAETYSRCPNCGGVFPSINRELYNGFCSLECEALYDEEGIIISNRNTEEQL